MELRDMAVKGRRRSRTSKKRPNCCRKRRITQKGGASALNGAGAPPLSPSKPPPTLQVVGAAQSAPFQVESEVQAQPKAAWTAPPPETYYTLIAWDPDAPAKSWLHWLVANITGPDPTTGEEVVSWAPPTPPAGTGPHRYIFGLFSHPTPLELSPPKERGNFQLEAFATQHQLTFEAWQAFRVKPPA